MRITMLSTDQGSEDGIRIRTYEAGRVYDLSDALARQFLQRGSAQAVSEAKPPKRTTKKSPRQKQLKSAPENK